MPRKTYKKLVRDLIPEIITKTGATPKTFVLTEDEFRDKLKEKLVEEAIELKNEKDDILNELADVYELLLTIGVNYSIDLNDIIRKAKEKIIKRGAFTKKIFLEWVDEPEN